MGAAITLEDENALSSGGTFTVTSTIEDMATESNFKDDKDKEDDGKGKKTAK